MKAIVIIHESTNSETGKGEGKILFQHDYFLKDQETESAHKNRKAERGNLTVLRQIRNNYDKHFIPWKNHLSVSFVK